MWLKKVFKKKIYRRFLSKESGSDFVLFHRKIVPIFAILLRTFSVLIRAPRRRNENVMLLLSNAHLLSRRHTKYYISTPRAERLHLFTHQNFMIGIGQMNYLRHGIFREIRVFFFLKDVFEFTEIGLSVGGLRIRLYNWPCRGKSCGLYQILVTSLWLKCTMWNRQTTILYAQKSCG